MVPINISAHVFGVNTGACVLIICYHHTIIFQIITFDKGNILGAATSFSFLAEKGNSAFSLFPFSSAVGISLGLPESGHGLCFFCDKLVALPSLSQL